MFDSASKTETTLTSFDTIQSSPRVESLLPSVPFPTPEMNFLLLSTSLLIDRVYRYTGLVHRLAENGRVTIWASSFEGGSIENGWHGLPVDVETFPDVLPFREFPYNYFRRLNEFVWDYRYKLPSRMSMMRHRRDKKMPFLVRALKPPARIFASLRMETLLEDRLEKLLLSYPRSQEAEERLRKLNPDLILSTGPFQFEQPAIFSAAKKLGIPTVAYVPSWDNVSTKNRMVFNYDGYFVWNDRTRNELQDFYPSTVDRPVYVIGSPQFDVFSQPRFQKSREDFCEDQGLDPSLPIVVYAIGSPNFLHEKHGAEYLAGKIAEGGLGDIQLLVRPHPIHDNAEMQELFNSFGPRVFLQKARNAGKALNRRSQDDSEITEWFNTFKHADVVVNLSSTVAIDAAILDTPVINLDFDPQPGQADQKLVKEINHEWPHFKPVAESGGIWLVNDFDELIEGIKTYLKHPELHRERRRWVAEYVCGFADGQCGERMADAILDFGVKARTGN